MPIELKMPALSPTMEEGTLAKWLVKEGDDVKSGDILAEIETDKATMEFEAVDEGKIAKILVPEGTDGVKVGAPIAIMAGEGEDACAAASAKADTAAPAPPKRRRRAEGRRDSEGAAAASAGRNSAAPPQPAAPPARGGRPHQGLAARAPARAGAEHRPVQPSRAAAPAGASSGPTSTPRPARRLPLRRAGAPPQAAPALGTHPSCRAPMEQAIPHEAVKLSNIRKTIARRLTESKQQVPHIYLTVDIQLDALLEAARRAQRRPRQPRRQALRQRPADQGARPGADRGAGMQRRFAGDQLLKYSRADISVAVSIPAGLITPIIVDADNKSVSAISTEMKDLAARARDGKLQPQRISGRHRSLQQHGHVRDQAVRSGHQPAAGHDHGDRRGREAALRHQ